MAQTNKQSKEERIPMYALYSILQTLALLKGFNILWRSLTIENPYLHFAEMYRKRKFGRQVHTKASRLGDLFQAVMCTCAEIIIRNVALMFEGKKLIKIHLWKLNFILYVEHHCDNIWRLSSTGPWPIASRWLAGFEPLASWLIL